MHNNIPERDGGHFSWWRPWKSLSWLFSQKCLNVKITVTVPTPPADPNNSISWTMGCWLSVKFERGSTIVAIAARCNLIDDHAILMSQYRSYKDLIHCPTEGSVLGRACPLHYSDQDLYANRYWSLVEPFQEFQINSARVWSTPLVWACATNAPYCQPEHAQRRQWVPRSPICHYVGTIQ